MVLVRMVCWHPSWIQSFGVIPVATALASDGCHSLHARQEVTLLLAVCSVSSKFTVVRGISDSSRVSHCSLFLLTLYGNFKHWTFHFSWIYCWSMKKLTNYDFERRRSNIIDSIYEVEGYNLKLVFRISYNVLRVFLLVSYLECCWIYSCFFKNHILSWTKVHR
jgi:hypothetical protein